MELLNFCAIIKTASIAKYHKKERIMNKGDFIKAVAEKANCTQKDAGIVFDAMVDTIVSVLKDGDKIVIPGFGSFELVKKAATTKINPLNKKPVKVPACKQPKFKFGKSFKAIFND